MKAAVCIRTDPIDRNALPRWIMERAKEKTVKRSHLMQPTSSLKEPKEIF